MNKLKEISSFIGMKYGRFTVLEKAENVGTRRAVLCRCECGKEKVIPLTYLKNGKIKSCGCLMKDVNRKVCISRNTTHGKSKSRLHNIWCNMNQRCNNKNANGYKNYGGKGVSVCEEWKEFSNFETWALQNRYNDNLTIDRIDNDGNYCPQNCQWLTRSENTIKRNNKNI